MVTVLLPFPQKKERRERSNFFTQTNKVNSSYSGRKCVIIWMRWCSSCKFYSTKCNVMGAHCKSYRRKMNVIVLCIGYCLGEPKKRRRSQKHIPKYIHICYKSCSEKVKKVLQAMLQTVRPWFISFLLKWNPVLSFSRFSQKNIYGTAATSF